MKKRVIFDSDNTMGICGCDVDDGLALLFLLGNDDLCEIEGLTCSYGNSTIDAVHSNTLRLTKELGVDIPVLKGAAAPGDPSSEAADFIASRIAQAPGEISLLATGSLTNLRGAAIAGTRAGSCSNSSSATSDTADDSPTSTTSGCGLDGTPSDPSVSDFLDNAREIALMGGTTRALAFKGAYIDELNFSCDPDATLMVLQAPCPVMDAVSQNCLPCYFRRSELESEFGRDSWLLDACNDWFSTMGRRFEWEGFVCWDLVAAAWLLRPDLFDDSLQQVTLYRRWLEVGLLELDGMPDAPTATVNFPTIKDVDELKHVAVSAWHRALA